MLLALAGMLAVHPAALRALEASDRYEDPAHALHAAEAAGPDAAGPDAAGPDAAGPDAGITDGGIAAVGAAWAPNRLNKKLCVEAALLPATAAFAVAAARAYGPSCRAADPSSWSLLLTVSRG
jgi:hypothetical protein